MTVPVHIKNRIYNCEIVTGWAENLIETIAIKKLGLKHEKQYSKKYMQLIQQVYGY